MSSKKKEEDHKMSDGPDREERQRLIIYGITAVFAVVLIALFAKTMAPDSSAAPALSEPQRDLLEITAYDIFPLGNRTGEDISVFGVVLGDTKAQVIDKIGLPDLETTYPQSTNWEYREGLLLDRVGLLIHFDNDVVMRITIKDPFNKYLHGETVIDHNKADIFRLFGKPDESKLLSFFTQYSYYGKGFEVFQSRKRMNGFSLIPVQPDKVRNSVIDPSIVLKE